MTLTLWPTTSWSSRAMRARSSATAARARSSRFRSARAARSRASSASANLRPSAKPTTHTTVKDEGDKDEVADAALWVGSRDDRLGADDEGKSCDGLPPI